jgi:hypothetical protein
MDIFIMYFLMLCDLLFTFFNFREAEELNPLFQKLLYGSGQVWFIYLKLALNTAAAYAIIIIRRYKRGLSIFLALLGIIVYATVFYLHIEIYQVNHGQDPITPGLKQMLFATEDAAGDVFKDIGIAPP